MLDLNVQEVVTHHDNVQVFYCRWLRLCVKAGWEDVFSMAVTFVSEQGRMKFVRPLYR